MNTHVIVAIDTSDLDAALETAERLSPHVFAFKVGHALVLPYGLDVVGRLQDVGAQRIFLDLKFHDIPNSVALGVYEAAKRGVWMMTLHASGGRAMMAAAVEAAGDASPEVPPILLGVTVLTSLDDAALKEECGFKRNSADQALFLAEQAIRIGLDGIVCSGHEVARIRAAVGSEPVLVTPGIRANDSPKQDQARTVSPKEALAAGANYIVVGRALTSSADPEEALAGLGL